ncbi:hypothetical protein HN51_052445 [Arachis hypogaea]
MEARRMTKLLSLPQREAESLCPALFRRSRRSLRRRELSRPPPTLGGTTSALLPLSIFQSVSATFQFLLVGCHSFLGLYSALGEYRKKRKLQNEMGSAPLSSWPWENFGLFKYVLYGPLLGKVVYEWLNGVELYSMISCWSLHLLILWILRGGVHVLWSS